LYNQNKRNRLDRENVRVKLNDLYCVGWGVELYSLTAVSILRRLGQVLCCYVNVPL